MTTEPGFDAAELKSNLLSKLGAEHAHLYPAEVEKQFPRLLERIVDLWNSPELDYFFEGLLTTTRHDRQGFPDAVALELFHLSNLHSRYRLSGLTSKSPWDVVLDPELFKKPD